MLDNVALKQSDDAHNANGANNAGRFAERHDNWLLNGKRSGANIECACRNVASPNELVLAE